MPSPEIKVLSIEDFKGGIFSDFHAGTSNTASATFDPKINGSAVVADTWGCCADRSGALVPLPLVSSGKTSALIPPTAGSHGSALPDTYLLDAIVMDRVQVEGSAEPAIPEVVTMHNFVYNTTGSTWSSYLLVRRWESDGSSTSDVCFTRSVATQAHAEIISGNLLTTRASETTDSALTPYLLKGFAWVAHPARTTAVSSGAQFVTGAIVAADQSLTDYDTKYAPAWSNNYPYRLKDGLFGYFPNFGTPTFIHPAGPAHIDGSAGATGATGASGAGSIVAPSSSWVGTVRFTTPSVSHGTTQCHFVPYYFDRAVTISKMAIQVDTGAASATCSLGLYNHNTTTGLPSTLIYDAGSVSCTSSGYKIITLSTPQTVGPGVVWAACLTLTAVITVWGCGSNSTGAMGGATAYHSAVSGSSPGGVALWPTQNGLSALPSSVGTLAWISNPILTFMGLQ